LRHHDRIALEPERRRRIHVRHRQHQLVARIADGGSALARVGDFHAGEVFSVPSADDARQAIGVIAELGGDDGNEPVASILNEPRRVLLEAKRAAVERGTNLGKSRIARHPMHR
jgi:hypothetical protein